MDKIYLMLQIYISRLASSQMSRLFQIIMSIALTPSNLFHATIQLPDFQHWKRWRSTVLDCEVSGWHSIVMPHPSFTQVHLLDRICHISRSYLNNSITIYFLLLHVAYHPAVRVYAEVVELPRSSSADLNVNSVSCMNPNKADKYSDYVVSSISFDRSI